MVTHPGTRGGDSRIDFLQMVVMGHKAKKSHEGRQSRERQATLSHEQNPEVESFWPVMSEKTTTGGES
jgi:hypothetical protein